jgi:hypothetical protein
MCCDAVSAIALAMPSQPDADVYSVRRCTNTTGCGFGNYGVRFAASSRRVGIWVPVVRAAANRYIPVLHDEEQVTILGSVYQIQTTQAMRESFRG